VMCCRKRPCPWCSWGSACPTWPLCLQPLPPPVDCVEAIAPLSACTHVGMDRHVRAVRRSCLLGPMARAGIDSHCTDSWLHAFRVWGTCSACANTPPRVAMPASEGLHRALPPTSRQHLGLTRPVSHATAALVCTANMNDTVLCGSPHACCASCLAASQ
jgi:hypothetical protein